MPARLGLGSLCVDLVAELRADACCVSRVLGDVLIQVAEHVRGGGTVMVGQGYLVSDFPLTVEVLRQVVSRTVWTRDPAADAAEAQLLHQLGFEGLVMVPLVLDGEVWGLVEVYRRGAGFSSAEVANAEGLIGAVAAAAAA